MIKLHHWLPCIAALAIATGAPGLVHAAPPPSKPAPTPAIDWSTTMSGDAVASYLRETDRRVIVVAGGEPSPALEDARRAVEAGLRSSRKLDVVMDASALGSVAGLGDQQIVELAKHQAVDAIAIVRTFGDGADISLVVTFYATDGSVVNAFSLAAGDQLAAASGGSNTAGVSEKAIGSVSEVISQNSEATNEYGLTDAEIEYLDKFLHYQYVVYFNTQTGAITAGKTNTALRGVENQVVVDSQFFDYVGKPDEAERHRKRKALKSGLVLPGVIFTSTALPAGLALLVVGALAPCELSLDANCSGGRSMVIAGGTLTGFGVAGLGMLIAGAVIPKVLTPARKRQEIDEYNRGLRTRLGLPDDVEDQIRAKLAERLDYTSRKDRVASTIQISPAVSTVGAGVFLSGKF